MARMKRAASVIFLAVFILTLTVFFFLARLPGTRSSAATTDYQISNGTLISYKGTETRITIPSEVKVIGAEAFAGNTTLTVVVIGDNVKEIKSGAFSNNTSLKRVSIGESVKEIDSGIFAGCDSLTSVAVDKDNPWFVVEGNALYNTNKSVLYAYFGGSKTAKFSMPSSVTKIMNYAFWGNDYLQEVNLSSSLREISGYAFSGCKTLSKIDIPYSVKSIDTRAFENCSSLGEVEISSSVGYIHSTAFDGCSNLVIQANAGTVAYTFYQDWKANDWGKTVETSSLLVEQVVDGDTATVSGNDAESGGKVYVVGGNNQVTTVDKNGVSSQNTGSTSDGSQSTDTTSAVDRARNHPSNVDYIPQSDPLDTVEDGVVGKTIVVGRNAVILMDSSLPVTSGESVQSNDSDEAEQ
ncbi:MAG: leucine-rich repeat domain-containing protein [Lachnospiraceae bacterium]|nr:leucine-rich repeat domain-containing protein [Lachnospiraceae bacterium]